MTGDGVEQALEGGVANSGAVVRVGDTVRRPGGPNSTLVHRLLSHLEDVGFEGAPRFLGHDERGREVLSFVEGAVAVPPFPDWVADEILLLSVAELQRELHVAAAGFALPDAQSWQVRTLPPGGAGAHVCHTDLCLENVVVRDGRAAAFIDFDLAAPVNPLLDIAIAARHWVPLRDPADIDDARRRTDLVGRFHAFTGVHGLDAQQRDRVVDLLLGFLTVSLEDIRAAARAGHPGFAQVWADGYEAMNARSFAWLTAHRPQLATMKRHVPAWHDDRS